LEAYTDKISRYNAIAEPPAAEARPKFVCNHAKNGSSSALLPPLAASKTVASF